jgi:hypothetical protein
MGRLREGLQRADFARNARVRVLSDEPRFLVQPGGWQTVRSMLATLAVASGLVAPGAKIYVPASLSFGELIHGLA